VVKIALDARAKLFQQARRFGVSPDAESIKNERISVQ